MRRYPINPEEIAMFLEDIDESIIPNSGHRKWGTRRSVQWKKFANGSFGVVIATFAPSGEGRISGTTRHKMSGDEFQDIWDDIKDQPDVAAKSPTEAPTKTPPESSAELEDPEMGQYIPEGHLNMETFLEYMEDDKFALSVARYSRKLLAKIFIAHPDSWEKFLKIRNN